MLIQRDVLGVGRPTKIKSRSPSRPLDESRVTVQCSVQKRRFPHDVIPHSEMSLSQYVVGLTLPQNRWRWYRHGQNSMQQKLPK